VQRRDEARTRLRLVIVGNGSERSACAELVRGAGADDLVWLPGERNDIPSLMRAFDVFVLPSLGEGISNTILEAMASGLPIVATRVGGNVELVEEGATGALVRPSDPEAVADALESYFVNPELRCLMGRNARMAAESTSVSRAWSTGIRRFTTRCYDPRLPLRKQLEAHTPNL
jgi:glycosyltransferase involved in cell wall biosynthesis